MPPSRPLSIVVLVVHCLLLSSFRVSDAGCPYEHEHEHEHRYNHHHSQRRDDDAAVSLSSSSTGASALPPTAAVDSFYDPNSPAYRLPPNYEHWSARHKLRYIWGELLVNQTSATLVELSEGLIFTESMVPTVEFNSDLIPKGRRKAVHGDGVVCQARLRLRRLAKDLDRPWYTGVLSRGSDTVILRLSSVLDPIGRPLHTHVPQY